MRTQTVLAKRYVDSTMMRLLKILFQQVDRFEWNAGECERFLPVQYRTIYEVGATLGWFSLTVSVWNVCGTQE